MNIVCSVFVCSLTMLSTTYFRLPQDFSRCVGKYSRLKGSKYIVTNIGEVQISCQEENLKTAIDVYFLLLFKCKRSEFSLLQTVSSLFLCFFLRHTIQNLNLDKPEEILELKLDTLLAFSPCIRTMIKYTVSTRQSTCPKFDEWRTFFR